MKLHRNALIAAAATTVASTVSASKWPLRAPAEYADAIPADFDCAMRQAAYSFGKELLPRLGAFEPLYYALDLNDPACPPTEVKADAPMPRQAPNAVPAGSVFVAPSGGVFGWGKVYACMLFVRRRLGA